VAEQEARLDKFGKELEDSEDHEAGAEDPDGEDAMAA
jgi:hypothetical protein